MFSVFPIPGETHDERRLRLQTYWDTIKDFPASAVEIAIAKVRRGVFPQMNRSFAPTPAELSEAIRGVLASGPAKDTGDLTFDGEVPMTWVDASDPRWGELCRVARQADPKNRHMPMTSKYAPGRVGSFFRSAFVALVPKPTWPFTANQAPPRVEPPPYPMARTEAELRALKPGSLVNYEEAMILTNGRRPIGRAEGA